MTLLADRIRRLELDLSPGVMYQGNLPVLLGKALDELESISEEAIRNKNYQALGLLDRISVKLSSRTLPLIDKHPELVHRVVSICKVEAYEATDLLIRFHNEGTVDENGGLIDCLINNIIKNETFHSIANPRIAKDLLAEFMLYSHRISSIIKLCNAIAYCNTRVLPGASFVLAAISTVEKITCREDHESRLLAKAKTNIIDKKPMIEVVDNWLKAAETDIAESIRSGEPSEWTSMSAIDVAESRELPLIAANLYTRMDTLPLPELTTLAEKSGFFTDRSHVDAVLAAYQTPSDPARLPVIAYCLMHKDMLPDSIFSGDFPTHFANAALLMGSGSLHPVHGKAILARFVDHLKPEHDISILTKTKLHKDLMGFRKYRGMLLEHDIGM